MKLRTLATADLHLSDNPRWDRMKGNKLNVGRTLTAEHRSKISKTKKGMVFSAAHRRKLSAARQAYLQKSAP